MFSWLTFAQVRQTFFTPWATFLGCVFFLSSCGQQAEYFPLGTWPTKTVSHWTDEQTTDFYENWFSKHLRAMNEPSLVALSKTTDMEHIRLLVLPSFSFPVAIHIRKQSNGEARLEFTQLGGAGGYEPGRIQKQYGKTLSTEELRRIEQQIDALHLWYMGNPAQRPVVCFDGTQVVFEIAKNGYFHAVSQHECEVKEDMATLWDTFDRLVEEPVFDPLAGMKKMLEECLPPMEPEICKEELSGF